MNIRNLAALAGIAIAIAATAAPVSPEEALRRATTDSATPRAVRAATAGRPSLVHTSISSSGAPAVYLFSTKNNGFMMLPADDTAAPVLAYGDSQLEEGVQLPANVAWWISEYAREIEYAATLPAPALHVTRDAGRASRPAIAPMVTTKWNQDAPYNSQCPVINNVNAVTGCMATAMAQVMNYHKWPAAGTGSIDYTDDSGNSRSMTFGEFDWDNMLDKYTYTNGFRNFTAAQGDAVAFLMKSCGYAARMHYTAYASGASTSNAVNALKTYFNYNPNIYTADRQYFGIDQWEETIYDNLRNSGPVLYTGADYSAQAGHAFVCDGYSSDGFFHFNWGWGGMCDGYFRLTALNPSAVGIGGGAGQGFNFYQEVVLGIQPEATASPARPANISQGGDLVLSLAGNTLTLSCENGLNNGFFNMTDASISGLLGIMIENSEGYTEFEWVTRAIDLPGHSGIAKYSVRIPDLENGVYRIYPSFKPAGSSAGTRMEQPVSAIRFGYLTVSSSGSTIAMPAAGNVTVSGVSTPTGFYIGQNFQVNATFTNDGSSEFYGPVAVGIGRRNGTSVQIVAYGSIDLIDVRPGESADHEFISALTTVEALSPDEYIMLIFNAESYQIYYSQSCTVSANPGAPTLRATDFSVIGDATAVNARELSFHANVGCSAGYFSGYTVISLFEVNGSRTNAVESFYAPAPLFLAAGETKEITLDHDFQAGKIGSEYIAQLYYVYNYSMLELAQCTFTVVQSETGLDGVTADGYGAPAEYYDLTGRRVTTPEPGHIYLRRTAGKVDKVVF